MAQTVVTGNGLQVAVSDTKEYFCTVKWEMPMHYFKRITLCSYICSQLENNFTFEWRKPMKIFPVCMYNEISPEEDVEGPAHYGSTDCFQCPVFLCI